MRKFVLASLALFVCFGLSLAGEVTFMKFDKEKKELTVKDGDKETTYKITDDVKVKDGDKEGKLEGAMKRFEKAKEGKTKFEITVEKDKLTEIKFKAGKKKADKN